MNNIFSKKLFSVTNKSNRSYLILAFNNENALLIAIQKKMAKNINNLKIVDISESYITSDRLKSGLDFDRLKEGKFYQAMNGQKSEWFTT